MSNVRAVRTMFGGVRGVTISDVAYSLALVNRLQLRRAENGDVYMKAAKDYKDSSSPPRHHRHRSSSSKATPPVGEKEVQEEVRLEPQLIEQDYNHIRNIQYSPLQHEPKNTPFHPHDDVHEREQMTVRGVLLSFLSMYYSKYAVAACGWPMLVNPYNCILWQAAACVFARYERVLYLEPCSALSLGGCCCNPPKVEDSVGATCCHSNERAFLKWTGLSPSDMLFASMVADLERLHYYVVADHKKRKMVIAIRGTMSFQDMATDARQNYVPITEDSTLLVPEGFLMCAKRCMHVFLSVERSIKRSKTVMAVVVAMIYNQTSVSSKLQCPIIREVRANQKLQRFLKSHEDYGVVFTGHSLGASAGTVATILLSLDKSW
eukprot:jgi/Bigna1/75553/fgenesh1_pg.35_\